MKFFDVTADPEEQRLPLLRRKDRSGDPPQVVDATFRMLMLLRAAARASGDGFSTLAISARTTSLVSAAEEIAQGGKPSDNGHETSPIRAGLRELVTVLQIPAEGARIQTIIPDRFAVLNRCTKFLEKEIGATKPVVAETAGTLTLCGACGDGNIGSCKKLDQTPCCFQKAVTELLHLI